MSMKRFLAVLFALIVVSAVACGGGEKSSAKDDGVDDGAEPATTAATTAGTAPAPAAAAVAADAGNITGSVKLDGAAPKAANIQMSADPYCQSQHSAPVADEDVVVSPTGQL